VARLARFEDEEEDDDEDDDDEEDDDEEEEEEEEEEEDDEEEDDEASVDSFGGSEMSGSGSEITASSEKSKKVLMSFSPKPTFSSNCICKAAPFDFGRPLARLPIRGVCWGCRVMRPIRSEKPNTCAQVNRIKNFSQEHWNGAMPGYLRSSSSSRGCITTIDRRNNLKLDIF
jgi:hypothetical protein